MSDLPPLPLGAAHHAPRGRSFHARTDSLNRLRHVSDLVPQASPQATPRTAPDLLRNPSGALKACMDASTLAEQSFAIRVATASQNVREWLDELASWPWPTHDSSAGFDRPPPKRRKLFPEGALFGPEEAPDDQLYDNTYMGSLPAADLSRYERRLEEINRDMDELDLDEIKTRILHNHIMPLSRPGTPMSESTRSAVSSSSAYVRMDDLTAMITTLTIQALPNLSRVAALMSIWTVRLTVLRKTSGFLAALADAEAALQSAWNAADLGSGKETLEGTGHWMLSQNDFRVMKLVLERKVSKAGHQLDLMLDALEGGVDTLPESWIDRMDSSERSYGEWVATCEKKMREAEWARLLGKPSFARAPAAYGEPGTAGAPAKTVPEAEAAPTAAHFSDDSVFSHHSSDTLLPSIEFDTSVTIGEKGLDLPDLSDDSDSAFDNSPRTDTHEPDLPRMPKDRRDSVGSTTSTVIHGSQGRFLDLSSDALGHGTPARIPNALRSAPSEGISPSSSPPSFRPSARPVSVSFSDMPTVLEVPNEESLSQFPIEFSALDEEGLAGGGEVRSAGGLRKLAFAGSDEQLHQQISEILETIPAKIKLANEPSSNVNLNPPDFALPPRGKSKADPALRGQSSISNLSSRASSRAGTPSFTLAPAFARSPRPRSQRGNSPKTKLYHLSRPNGEPPIKLLIRCVGESGERVMVRVGGGWADLGEYLKEYATHHGPRSGGEWKVDFRDMPRMPGGSCAGSSPPSRPGSAMETSSPITPLSVRKTRKNPGEEAPARLPKTPLGFVMQPAETPMSDLSTRSSSSSRLSWAEEDSSLGMAGPKAKHVEMSEESRAWVESIKQKVRVASGECKVPGEQPPDGRFGDMGRVGTTKRVFRRPA